MDRKGSRRIAGGRACRLLGRRLLGWLVRIAPKLYVRALNDYLHEELTLDDVPLPPRLDSFEALAPLFSHPVAGMNAQPFAWLDVAEAALLYRVVRSLEAPTVVEIGRAEGGSTLLLAAAMRGGRVLSLDNDARRRDGATLDARLQRILRRYGLADAVNLVIADSATYPPFSHDVLFIDGDHSYEGVMRDIEHWTPYLRPGGHVLFDDTNQPGVAQALGKLGSEFRLIQTVTKMAHYVLKPQA